MYFFLVCCYGQHLASREISLFLLCITIYIKIHIWMITISFGYAYLLIQNAMKEENEHSLCGIEYSEKVTEEQGLSVESHQTKHPSEAKNWEDHDSRFHTSFYFSNIVLQFDLMRIHHGAENHHKYDGVNLEEERKKYNERSVLLQLLKGKCVPISSRKHTHFKIQTANI